MSTSASGEKIVFIGAGRVATHLAPALDRLDGVEVTQVYSRTMESASALATVLKSATATDRTDAVVPDADIYIVSLADDAVAPVVEKLRGRGREALWLHTSGSLPMDVLSGLSSRFGVFYPLQTFSKNVDVDMSKVPFFIENSSPRDEEMTKHLASRVSGKVHKADGELRRKIHIAAVFACNFTNYMWTIADDLLKADGLTLEVLYPLLEETLGKVERISPAEGQTGPAIRGDRRVMDKHISMLAGDPADIYRLLSDSIYNYHHHRNEQDKL